MKVLSLLIAVILIVAAHAIEYKHEYQQHQQHQQHEEEEHGPVEYEFHYSVHDPHTGDIKSQKEKRKDDKVEGSYELIDSDGHRRIVHYKADKHSGFEAIVLREPTDIKIPIPEKRHEYQQEQKHEKILIHQAAPIVHYGHKNELHHDYHYKY